MDRFGKVPSCQITHFVPTFPDQATQIWDTVSGGWFIIAAMLKYLASL